VRRADPTRAGWVHHVAFGLAVLGCLAAGWFELGRARGGREIAWVYTVEWPVFAVAFGFMWWHMARDRGSRRQRPPGGRAGDIPADDAGLRAWRDYLAALEHDGDTTDRAPGSG
jgi:hypothetical protein